MATIFPHECLERACRRALSRRRLQWLRNDVTPFHVNCGDLEAVALALDLRDLWKSLKDDEI
jgi:hypothetical protein